MTVAIVGAGASGTLTATHLLRAGGRQRLVLHESGSTVARGAAYGTTDDRHLLNVRAIDMSGLPDEQRHLLAWAERSGEPVHEHAFMPRRRYGAYLTDLLASSASAAQGRLEIRHDAITDLARVPGGFEVRTADGGHQVTTVVLAHGNLRPRDLAVDGAPLPDAPWHVAVPWRPGALEHLSPTATVVLVGSGLTAVDVAVTLLSDAPSRRVVMVSRHGELPRRHTVFPWRAG